MEIQNPLKENSFKRAHTKNLSWIRQLMHNVNKWHLLYVLYVLKQNVFSEFWTDRMKTVSFPISNSKSAIFTELKLSISVSRRQFLHLFILPSVSLLLVHLRRNWIDVFDLNGALSYDVAMFNWISIVSILDWMHLTN